MGEALLLRGRLIAGRYRLRVLSCSWSIFSESESLNIPDVYSVSFVVNVHK